MNKVPTVTGAHGVLSLKKNGKEDATPMKRERKGGPGRAKGLKRNEIISSFW